MKKIILILTVLVICIVCTSCTYSNYMDFSFNYDKVSRSCTLKNISSFDYNQLEVTLVLHGEDGFEKKIKEIVGDLKSGEEYSFELLGISEETQVDEVIFESYEYYENTGLYVLAIFAAAAAAVGLLAGIIYFMCWLIEHFSK